MKTLLKRWLRPILFTLVALFGVSCYSAYPAPHAKRGAVLGGVAGAVGGALIGEHKGRELEGAAVGGVVGAIAGGLLGSAADDDYHRYSRSSSAPPPPYRGYAESHHRPYYGPAPRVYIRPSFSYGWSRHHHHHHRPRYGYCR